MDALAQLALMTKAKLVFESPDTFLSFPALMPISYSPDEMKFQDATSARQMKTFLDFSTLTNALPQGTLFQPSLDRVLSDVYQGVLENAQLAQGILTADQTAELESAQSFLSVQDDNGLPVDSPRLVAYKRCRQAWFAATQDYNNQKISATASADPNVQAQWRDNGEPLARAKVEAAVSDWETNGLKAQIEQAQQIEQTCEARSPQSKWKNWRDLCRPAIDFPTDPITNTPFAPTMFSPYDIIDHGAWPTFSIVGSDIPNLVTQAPAELANMFRGISGSTTIDSLSFEYCSVVLNRPWYRPEVFQSRFWRLSDPTAQLSDGNVPPQGDWPAYIAAVVFARNIVVTTHDAAVTPLQPMRTFPPLLLENVHIAQQPAARPMPAVLRPQVAVFAMTAAPIAQPQVRAMLGRRVAMVEPSASVARPAAAFVAPSRAMTAASINAAVRARLAASTFSRTAVTTAGPTASPTPTPSIQTESSGTQISILAFICKRLPKCPNPDPSLNWG